jgi:hypothetical protein
MVLKKGSKGSDVKTLQEFLGLHADGDFGSGTEKAVKTWQSKQGLVPDGIVGSKTWDEMGLASTDNSEATYTTENGLIINRHYLPKGEYKVGPTSKEFLFLHHTAGWHKPHNCIDQWGRDDRGSIATEFVLGGPSVKGNDDEYDGKMLQAFPDGGYGWHLGKNGSQHMHSHSVGLEICNFGYIEGGKTYAGTRASSTQVVELDKPFRGHRHWHRYSNKQIEATKKLILYIAERDNIDVRDGLVQEIKKNGVGGFEFNEDAYYGKRKGMWTHTNTRKDKTDLFPQQEVIDSIEQLVYFNYE